MPDVIDALIEEHKIIEQVLDSLETFTESLDNRGQEDRATLRRFVEFFRLFADEWHHGKEEGHLFVRMRAFGFSSEQGPITAMLSEQGEGREHLNAMAAVGDGSGPLSARERAIIRGHALGYVSRIHSHMKREDDILFPVIRHVLPSFVMDDLSVEFDNFDRVVATASRRDRIIESARELSRQFPPMRTQPVSGHKPRHRKG